MDYMTHQTSSTDVRMTTEMAVADAQPAGIGENISLRPHEDSNSSGRHAASNDFDRNLLPFAVAANKQEVNRCR